MTKYESLEELNRNVTACRLCPRLVHFREHVPPKKAFVGQTFWRKPVPGFGDPNAWLLITGLAPAADGGNRTGRPFTGDPSGRFLFKGLHAAGLANQATSESRDDGLVLQGCYITAAVKCVPPDNKPTRVELATCNCYYSEEFALLRGITHVLALGRLAADAFLVHAKKTGWLVPRVRFGHGLTYRIPGGATLFLSYHPSPQNTNTGLLTEHMFCELLEAIKEDKKAMG